MKTLLTALARLFAADRGRKPETHPAAGRRTPAARHAIRRPRTSAGFASVIVFETTCV